MIFQEQTPDFKTFAKTIEDYLLSIKSAKENVQRATNDSYIETGCILYSKSGIESLKIQPRTYIGIIYISDPSSFPNIRLDDYFHGENIVIFVNVERRFALNHNFSFRIVYLDDLDSKLYIKDNDNYVENDNPKGNCVPITKFDEYLRFSIRAKILSRLFQGLSYKIYDIKEESGISVFPFLYDDGFTKYIFFADKRDLLKTQFFGVKDDHIVYAQISIKNDRFSNNMISMTITYKETIDFDKTNYGRKSIHIAVNKMDVGELNEFAILFNRNSRYYVDEFIPLYKYRQFAKTRYSSLEEKVSYASKPIKYDDSYEICVGSRSAIENNSIWFSNYDSLNDPFDLMIRYPSQLTRRMSSSVVDFYEGTQYYDIKKTGILVFCTTRSDDNIFMWSHYGDSHKGMCTGYLQNEILSTIASDTSVGICLYGKVEYPPTRPVFRITLKELLFVTTNLAYFRFNIQNLFSKYRDWDYEKEYRFILVPTNDSYSDYIARSGHAMSLKPFNYVFGYNFPLSFNKYLSSASIKLNRFDLSNSEYKLIK
jgi:hypothetical protein